MLNMPKDKLQNAIAVMQAFLDGKKLQAKTVGSNHWQDVTTPIWDWFGNDYRIKPEPKEVWVVSWNSWARERHQATFDTKIAASRFLDDILLPCGATNYKITKFVEVTE